MIGPFYRKGWKLKLKNRARKAKRKPRKYSTFSQVLAALVVYEVLGRLVYLIPNLFP
jgi:hypothetical protein